MPSKLFTATLLATYFIGASLAISENARDHLNESSEKRWRGGGRNRVTRIDGHISHGVNLYNGLPIQDLTDSTGVFLFSLAEVGVFDPTPGATNASVVTAGSDRQLPMASIDTSLLEDIFGQGPGLGPANLPLQQVSTITLTSTSIQDRSVPVPFENTATDINAFGLYLSEAADPVITVEDWERAFSRADIRCNNDGTADVSVRIEKGLPNGLYTMWDIGVANALTPEEFVSVGPFGGVPNVIATDENGRGSANRRVNFCPTDECAGSDRCTLYISLFYHYDHMIYGAAPTLDTEGITTGQYAGNQIQFYLQGDNIIPPQNPWRFRNRRH